jgi:CheY-like chemotaxis protein
MCSPARISSSLRQLSPEFERFCTQAITETLKQSLESLYREFSQRAAEQQTLTRTLGELVRNPPVSCIATATLREAAQKMSDAKVRTIVVIDQAGAPVGMFTLVDLLCRVVLADVSLARPVSEVMTAPIVTLPASVTAYEAMYVMAERGIRQVIVVENGRLHGVINERDLFALQRASMRQVIEGLHAADSVDRLKRVGQDLTRLAQNLLAQGVAAEPLTRTIAALNDALARRAIDLALHGIGSTTPSGAGSPWAARAAASRRSRPTRTTRCSSRCPRARTGAAPRAAARIRARRQRGPRRTRLSAVHGQCDGEQSRALPLDSGMEGEVPGVDTRADAAGAPEREHRLRFPAAVRRHDARDALRAWLLGYTQANLPFLRLMVQNALDVGSPVGLIRAFAVDDEPRQGNARPQDARHRACSSTARACSRWRSASRTPARRPACASRASDCTSAAVTSQRRSRRFTSCSCCGCGSRRCPRSGQPNRIDPYCAARDRPADAEGSRSARQGNCRIACAYPIDSARHGWRVARFRGGGGPMAKRILIADDEPNIVVLARVPHEADGSRRAGRQHGEEALDAVSEFKPDLILLDIMMPRMSGYDLCQSVRENPAWKRHQDRHALRQGTRDRGEQGMAVGADAYVTKPFSTKELVAKVQQLLGE